MTDDRAAMPADSGATVAGYVSGLLLAALRSPGRDPERAERVAGGLVALLVAEGAARHVRPFLEAEPGRTATFEVRPISPADEQTEFFPEGNARWTPDLGDALRQALAMAEAGPGGALVVAVDMRGLRRRALECMKDGTVRLILPLPEAFEGETDLCSEAARRWRDFLARRPAPADPVGLASAGPRPGDVVRFAPATAPPVVAPPADPDVAPPADADTRSSDTPLKVSSDVPTDAVSPAAAVEEPSGPVTALSSAEAVEALAPSPGAGPVAPSQVMVEALADAVRAALADLTVEVDLENMEAALGHMVKQVVADSVGEVAREAATAATQAAAEATPPVPGPSAEEIAGRLTELLATEVAARVVVGLPAPPVVPSVDEVAAEVAARVTEGLPAPPVVPSSAEIAAEVATRVTEGLPAPPVVPSSGEIAAEVATRVVADLPAPPVPGPSAEEIAGRLTELLATEVAARVVADLPAPPVPGPSAEEIAGRLTELLATEVAARVVVGLPAPPVVPSSGEIAAEVATRVVADLPAPALASPAVPTADEIARAVGASMPSFEGLADQVLLQLRPFLTERLVKFQEETLTSNSTAYTSLATTVDQLGAHVDASFERVRSSALETLAQELSARERALQTLAQELWAKESAFVSLVDFSQRIEASIDRVVSRLDELERKLEARRPRPLRAREVVAEEPTVPGPPVRRRPLRAREVVAEEPAVSAPPVRRRPLRAREEVPEEPAVSAPPVRRRARKSES